MSTYHSVGTTLGHQNELERVVPPSSFFYYSALSLASSSSAFVKCNLHVPY
jgi:hypothetical protein